MNSFDLLRPRTLDDALQVLATAKPPTIKAGGIDLLDRMKEGLDAPAAVLDLLPLAEMRGIASTDRLEIGALTTLAEVAASEDVLRIAPALAQAAAEAATPQIRHVATLGGNLLQRTRCWYYRTADYEPCYKRGGGECPAKEGRNKYHAIFDTAAVSCVCVNPSSLGPALLALDAETRIASEGGKTDDGKAARKTTTAPVGKLFSVGPDTDTTLEPGQILLGVRIPLGPARRSAYRELNERASFDWALVSCAVSFVLEGKVVRDSRVVLGAVSHKPIRRPEVEKLLDGQELTPELARAAGAQAAEGAKPLAENAYKVPIVKVLVARALLGAAGLEVTK